MEEEFSMDLIANLVLRLQLFKKGLGPSMTAWVASTCVALVRRNITQARTATLSDIKHWVTLCLQLEDDTLLSDFIRTSLPLLHWKDVDKSPTLIMELATLLGYGRTFRIFSEVAVKSEVRSLLARWLDKMTSPSPPTIVRWKDEGPCRKTCSECKDLVSFLRGEKSVGILYHIVRDLEAGPLRHLLSRLQKMNLEGIATWEVKGETPKSVWVRMIHTHRARIDKTDRFGWRIATRGSWPGRRCDGGAFRNFKRSHPRRRLSSPSWEILTLAFSVP